MSDLAPITHDEQMAAEDMCWGRSCPECGASDWLATGRLNDERVVVECDDCMRFGATVPLPKEGARQ